MKYMYVIFEQHSGTHLGICTSMEDAIAYTNKLQVQSDKRADQSVPEQYGWFQLPTIDMNEI